MRGLKIGDSEDVTVKPEEGYGVMDQEAFREVDKEKILTDALKVGAQLKSQDAAGKSFYARMTEVKGKKVVLDLNHPLAGKALRFSPYISCDPVCRKTMIFQAGGLVRNINNAGAILAGLWSVMGL